MLCHVIPGSLRPTWGHAAGVGLACSTTIGFLIHLWWYLRGRLAVFNMLTQVSVWTQDVDDTAIAEAAAATDGFSGRELAKMIASVQTAVYGGREPVLTVDLFRRVVAAKVSQLADHVPWAGE